MFTLNKSKQPIQNVLSSLRMDPLHSRSNSADDNLSNIRRKTEIRTESPNKSRSQIAIRGRNRRTKMYDFEPDEDEEEFENEHDEDDSDNLSTDHPSLHPDIDDDHALSLNATRINKRGKDTVTMDEYQDSYLPLIKSVDDSLSIYNDPSLLNTILKFSTFVICNL